MFTDGTLLFCVTRIRKTQLGEVKEIKKKKKRNKKPSILMISCSNSSSDNILGGDTGRGTNKQVNLNRDQVVSFTSDSFFFCLFSHLLQSKTPFISILLIENNNNNRTGC